MKQAIVFAIPIFLVSIVFPSLFFAKEAVIDSISEKQSVAYVLQKDVVRISEKIVRKSKKLCRELAFLAIEIGDLHTLKSLTKDKDFNTNFVDSVGMSLLHYSVKYNFIGGVNVLLMYGANVNAINDLSMTPLHYAVKNGNIEIARILLSHGAEVKIGDKLGLTPTLFLFFSNECELDEMLCDPAKMLDLLMDYESEYGQQEYLKFKELFGSNPAFSRFFD